MEQSYSELRTKTITGVQWNAVSQIGGQGLTVIGSVVLSRILLPEYFGLFAMISVFGNVLNLMVGLGFGHAVVQNQDLTKRDAAALFWLNILFATIVAVSFFLAAPLIVRFYDQPQLLEVSRSFSVVFIICAACVVPTAWLARDINFRKLAISNLTAVLFSYGLGVGMALSGYGLWSLLTQYACFYFVTFLINFYYIRGFPVPASIKTSFKKIGRFSAGLLPSQLLDYFTSNIDVVLVGKYMGKNQLGLYGRAQAIIMLPVTNFSILLARSFFTLFSSLQQKQQALRSNFVNSTKVMVIITAPLLLGLAVVAREFVLLVFGEPWVAMTPLVSILCIGGVLASFNAMSDALLTSQGRTARLLKIVSIEKFILVTLVVGGIFYGVVGVALARVIAQLFSLIFRIQQQKKVVNIHLNDWLQAFWKLIASLVFMLCAALTIVMVLRNENIWVRFISPPVVSVIVFVICLAIFKEPIFFTLRKMATDKLKRR